MLKTSLSFEDSGADDPADNLASEEVAPPSKAQEKKEADRRLVERILAGEKEAFARWYDASAPALLRRLTRMTGAVDAAEDCLQQVFLEALRNLPLYRGDGSLDAWLERIATHVVMGWYRRKYRWRSFMEDLGEWIAPDKEASPLPEALPEQLFLQEEMKVAVWQILDRLPARKRMVLILCELEGHTIEDAAKQMDIPVGTAASRLFHARLAFRKAAILEFRRQGLSAGDWLHE